MIFLFVKDFVLVLLRQLRPSSRRIPWGSVSPICCLGQNFRDAEGVSRSRRISSGWLTFYHILLEDFFS